MNMTPTVPSGQIAGLMVPFPELFPETANRQRQIGDVIVRSNRKSLFFCIFIYSNDLSRCVVPLKQSVTACEYRCALESAAF